MIGRVHTNPRRVIILIDDEDGKQYGYELTGQISASWEWTGLNEATNRSTGRLTATGDIARKQRTGEVHEPKDEALPQGARGLPAGARPQPNAG